MNATNDYFYRRPKSLNGTLKNSINKNLSMDAIEKSEIY